MGSEIASKDPPDRIASARINGRAPSSACLIPTAAYLIVLIKITREEGWPEYRQQVSDLFAKHGGRYLVRGGPVEALEGSYDGRRLVVFEFLRWKSSARFGTRPNTPRSRNCAKARVN